MNKNRADHDDQRDFFSILPQLDLTKFDISKY